MNTSSKLRLFITGGTGYIGSGIIREFISKNWEVTALVRDLERAKTLSNLGAKLVKGELSDNEFLLKETTDVDLIIHAARDHGKDANDLDLQALNSFLVSAKANSAKKKCSFIYTSGCLSVGEGPELKDEACSMETPHAYGKWRVKHEGIVLAENNEKANLFTSVIRPTWVYGGNTGHVTDFLRFSQKEKVVTLVNKGLAYVNFVHVADLARLYALVYEKNGSGVYHGTDNVYITAGDISQGVAKYLNVEVKEFDVNAANEKYGFFAIGMNIDQKLVSKRSFNELGWKLEYPSFVGSLDKVFSELNN